MWREATMEMAPEIKQHIGLVGGEILEQFEEVEAAAKKKLETPPAPSPGSMASINTMTSGSTVQHLEQIGRSNRESYQILAREPAIARVVVVDNEGNQQTYYICRTTPLSLPKF